MTDSFASRKVARASKATSDGSGSKMSDSFRTSSVPLKRRSSRPSRSSRSESSAGLSSSAPQAKRRSSKEPPKQRLSLLDSLMKGKSPSAEPKPKPPPPPPSGYSERKDEGSERTRAESTTPQTPYHSALRRTSKPTSPGKKISMQTGEEHKKRRSKAHSATFGRKSVVGGTTSLKTPEEILAEAEAAKASGAEEASAEGPPVEPPRESKRDSTFSQFLKGVRPTIKEALGFGRESLGTTEIDEEVQQYIPVQEEVLGGLQATRRARDEKRAQKKREKSVAEVPKTELPAPEEPDFTLGWQAYIDEYGYREEVTPIRHWRPSSHEDLPDIVKLFRLPITRVMFGHVDIDLQMETSHTSLSEVNEGGRVVGHIALFEYPNVPVVPSFAWIEWIHNLYGVEFCTERNTLFIHLLVWDVKYSHVFLLPMLNTIFLNHIYISQIILILPPLVALPDILAEYFTIENPLDATRYVAEMNTMQRLAICMRHNIVPRFRMRKAVQSDNDDLIPIFNKITKKFRKKYGRYYIAEIISFPTPGRQCIVAERDQKAVGMMCLNDNINIDSLNENFDLIPFHGLRVWHEYDYVPQVESGSEDSRNHLRVLTEEGLAHDAFKMAPGSGMLRVAAAMKHDASRSHRSGSHGSMTGSIASREDRGSTRSHQSSEEAESDEQMSSSSSEIDLYLEEMEEASMVKDRFIDEDEDLEKQESSIDITYAELMSKHRNTIVDMSPTNQFRMKKLMEPMAPDVKDPLSAEEIGPLTAPEYHGPPNAFAIELFGLHDAFDERQAFDFLEAAFDCFPKMDYALLSMAPRFPTFPLLQHFVRVTPSQNRCFPHELFIAHRLSVYGNMRVRHVEKEDLSEVRVLVRGLPSDEDLLTEAVSSVARAESPFRCFIMTCEACIVGVAVVRHVVELTYLRSHYDVEALVELSLHKDGSHGLLRHFFLAPPFQPHTRFFLREIHRLSDATCLYHCQFTRRKKQLEVARVVGAIGSMLPVAPRRGIQYQLDLIDPENQPLAEVTRHDEPFALYFMNKRYACMPRRLCTARIVVLGASDTGISFLETLVLGPVSAYLAFTNLTLISQHGLPDENPDASPCAMMVPFRGRYNASFLERMQLRTHVTLVYGFMVELNRRKKCVVLESDGSVPYDYLVLCCGEQFQRPLATRRAKRERQRWRCFRDRKRAVEEESPDMPLNVFLINSHMDACNSFSRLDRLIRTYYISPRPIVEGEVGPKPYQIVVYGHCIEAMAGIAALQAYNIPNKHIVYVEPFPTEPAISFFNDAEVDEAVMSQLREEGVTIYSSYTFNDWKIDEVRKKITHVTFESRTELLTLECVALYCYDSKNVNTRTFLALNRCSLVYDGHLVINNHFRTNDPSILAAGPMTKYSRRYYADHFRHAFYNSVEVGQTLAKALLKELDPEAEHILGRKTTWRTPFRPACREKDNFYKVPKFTRPVVTFCSLPGGYNYLYVTAPGETMPLEVAMCQDSYGQVLVTGDCKSDQGYFRVHFNTNNFVETITCYTKGDFAVENIISLYGKHERMLNNIMERFELGYILDFYEYFEEPWACALFHDRFPWLEVSMLEYLNAIPLFGTATVMRELTRIMSKTRDKRVVEQIMTSIEQLYSGSKVEKLIAYELLRFIHHNSDMLTMYAHPMKIREVLQGNAFSPFLQEPWRYK